VVDAGRAREIALYTGNDDNIVADLLTEFPLGADGPPARIVGGLLGHWAVWTQRVVEMNNAIKEQRRIGTLDSRTWLAYGVQVTDANAAFFDPANRFRGSIAGLHEVLRRQGLMQGNWCLEAHEVLSPGQLAEIDRVYQTYPHLHDDEFVAAQRDQWLR
jgi:hypothetical protein